MKCFIDAVQYLKSADIHEFIGNLVERTRLTELGQGQHRANLMLLKRAEFHHEAEVRVIVVDDDKNNADELLRIPFDPNVVFEEVTFEPRLIMLEHEERKEKAIKSGYNGVFGDSDLYRGAGLLLPLDQGWTE